MQVIHNRVQIIFGIIDFKQVDVYLLIKMMILINNEQNFHDNRT